MKYIVCRMNDRPFDCFLKWVVVFFVFIPGTIAIVCTSMGCASPKKSDCTTHPMQQINNSTANQTFAVNEFDDESDLGPIDEVPPCEDGYQNEIVDLKKFKVTVFAKPTLVDSTLRHRVAMLIMETLDWTHGEKGVGVTWTTEDSIPFHLPEHRDDEKPENRYKDYATIEESEPIIITDPGGRKLYFGEISIIGYREEIDDFIMTFQQILNEKSVELFDNLE